MRGPLLLLALGTVGALRAPTAAVLHTPHLKHQRVRTLRGGAVVSTQWKRYLRALEEQPMRTKMATAAVLSGTGDVIAQCLETPGTFALRRFLTLISVNIFYIVPILTFFYAANEKLAAALKLEDGWPKTAVQLAFDQLVNAPIVVAGFFAAFQIATAAAEVLCGGGISSIGAIAGSIATQLRERYVSTVIANWKIWVLPQLINFALIPPYGRVAFANVIALVWNVFLSITANK